MNVSSRPYIFTHLVLYDFVSTLKLACTFRSISRKHLPNYLNEFSFRWNTRKLDDDQRVQKAIKAIDGKRLQYRDSVEDPSGSSLQCLHLSGRFG